MHANDTFADHLVAEIVGLPRSIPATDDGETQRSQAVARLHVQYTVSRVLVESRSLDEAAPRILHSIGEALAWELGVLWCVDQPAAVLRCRTTWHIPALTATTFESISRQRRFSPGEGLPGQVWTSERPVWLSDLRRDGNFPRLASAADAGLHSALAFPVRDSRGVLGVIEFFSAAIRTPDEDLLAMVATLGNQIGQFVERTRAEQALRESEARHRAILETALDCIITIDQEGRVTEWNPAAETTFGWSRAEALGRDLIDLIFPPTVQESHRRGLQHYLATGEGPLLGTRVELTAQRADGTAFPVEVTITHIAAAGPPLFTGFVRDITERKRAEEEYARAEALRQADRLKAHFLANVSHELRTPLHHIKGYAATLLQRGQRLDEPSRQDYLHIIADASDKLTRLIDDLLDTAQLESGTFIVDIDSVRLDEVVRRVVQRWDGIEGHPVGARLPRRVPPLPADARRLEQVLDNLLANVVRHTPPDTPTTVSVEVTRDAVVVAVSDQGPGIAPEHLPFLFDRSYQAGGDAGSRQGSGLGLFISKGIVEQHGGRMWVEATPGAGTTFHFSLPRRRTRAAA